MFKKLVFGRSGLNSSVFEKLYISYSCILSIKQCDLRSFYIKMLYFSKNYFFQIFDRSNLLLNRSKMWQKLGLNLPGSISSRLVLDRSNMILKGFSHVLITLLILFQKLSLSLSLSPSFLDWSTSNLFFVIFFLIFLKGFCLQVLIRPYYPFFFILFTFFMHFRCNFRTNRFLGFWFLSWFRSKLIIGFLFLDVIKMFPMP